MTATFNPGQAKQRIRLQAKSVTRNAIELGYSEQASRFNVNNEQEAPGSYRIEWE